MDEAEQKSRAKEFVGEWLYKIDENPSLLEDGNDQPFWYALLRVVLEAPPPREFPIRFQERVGMEEKIKKENEADDEYGDDEEVKNTLKKIDVFLRKTGVIIENKRPSKHLDKPDNGGLTPFQQAYRYARAIALQVDIHWIITCNFSEFWIYKLRGDDRYDESKGGEDPTIRIALKDLPENLIRLKTILVGDPDSSLRKDLRDKVDMSIEAGELVVKIYDSLVKHEKEQQKLKQEEELDPKTLSTLNIFCVRLVFCLYAESAGFFNKDTAAFRDYILFSNTAERSIDERWTALDVIFEILNVDERKRRTQEERLKAFPYVNGGLFARPPEPEPDDPRVKIPKIDEATWDIIFEIGKPKRFDWSQISPTIFGAVFESTLNSKMRREGGMHYTSTKNIHKVIDPLFLDDLKAELEEIDKEYMGHRIKKSEQDRKLIKFQKKLGSLKFLDPACGSGNFLTETYLSLRELENRAIEMRFKDVAEQGQQLMGDIENPIEVKLGQFYGIEINDFAISVAKTAMWIAECQMFKETNKIIKNIEPFPLEQYTTLVEGNALKMDWASLKVETGNLWQFAEQQAKEAKDGSTLSAPISYDYIIGNPPFIGARKMKSGSEQKQDVETLFKGWRCVGDLDYVSCWFLKAANLMRGTRTRTAFVATDSITQGMNVANLLEPLFAAPFGIHIDFAYRSFPWENDAKGTAQVNCVVIGFSSAPNEKPRIIFDGNKRTEAKNINGYLKDEPNVALNRRSKKRGPICDWVPGIGIGNKPIDGGKYLFTEARMRKFLEQIDSEKVPFVKKFFKPWYGADEFLSGVPRWCLWLGDATPEELDAMPKAVMDVVNAVREYRKGRGDADKIDHLSEKPRHFHVENMPKSNYLVIPETSAGREYIPMAFFTPDVLCSNKLQLIPNATLFHFGVLTSDVHMAWVRAVSGKRGEGGYDYSCTLVYNNFPWVKPAEVADYETKVKKIEKTAQRIIDVRAESPNVPLESLYNSNKMSDALSEAHKANNKAVRELFGFKSDRNTTEKKIVQELFRRYYELAEEDKNRRKKYNRRTGTSR